MRVPILVSFPALVSWLLVIALMSGCGGSSSPAAPAVVPQFQHVVLVVEENHSYSAVIGNSQMPYLNALASQYGLATQYYANTHPSIGNYFMLTTGQVVTNDDNFGATVEVDNIVRRLVSAGKTWKSYAEGLPAVGYMADGPPPYAKEPRSIVLFLRCREQQRRSCGPCAVYAVRFRFGERTVAKFLFHRPEFRGRCSRWNVDASGHLAAAEYRATALEYGVPEQSADYCV
jgi:hypothetical protein